MNAQPRRVEHLQTDKGSVPVYTTAVVEQPWDTYTSADHATWATLFERQREILVGRAAREFLENQQKFGMTPQAIPKFTDLNRVLKNATGWELIGVEGLLPELTFFDHLANRRFPVTWWIRKPEQIDYISEPDLFHDLFGHVPLLLNPVFADYMQAYGQGGVKAHGIGPEALAQLTRLYWYTVEFGLIKTDEGLRIYGSGIASSFTESVFALDDPSPNRLRFDLERVMRTHYRIDDFQETYFVLRHLDDLLALAKIDFGPLYDRVRNVTQYDPGEVLATDDVITRGTGRYHRQKTSDN